MKGIRLVDLHKRHGATEVLKGINLEIADGDFMVFVGPSGCAKSTTLRLIAGLEIPSSGQIWLGDEMVNDVPPKARNLAMVFQSYALFPNMTVRQNLSFGMQVRGEESSKINSEVVRIAELLGLDSLLDRKPGTLSGGQAQRVALGRAIIRKPQAFLFDEPLSNLDAELRINMRAEISSLQRKLGTTTIYVTHDQTEAMTMGDRIAVMRAGELMQEGKPLDLYSDPDNLFVAGFLGNPKINLFAIADGCWPASEFLTRAANGSNLVAGLRAEDFSLGAARNDAEVDFSARVIRTEQLGHETLLWLGPSDDAVSYRPYLEQHDGLVIRISARQAQEIGDNKQTISIRFSPADAMLFDPSTEQRKRTPNA